jgi:hypothetical protein
VGHAGTALPAHNNRRIYHPSRSAFTFNFDLEDDRDESFDAIPTQKPTAVNNTDNAALALKQSCQRRRSHSPSWSVPHPYFVHRSSPRPAAGQLSALPEALSYSPLALPASSPTLVRRDLFDARFQLLAEGRDEQAALVDAPADLVPGVYEGGLKTWECALDLATYLDRDFLGAQAGRRMRGLRVLEVSAHH